MSQAWMVSSRNLHALPLFFKNSFFRRIFSTYAIVGAGMHRLADESDSLEKKTTFISRFV